MDSYLELHLLPDPEFPATLLMNALFAKLHRALVSYGNGRTGISFPDVSAQKAGLGMRMRLHGERAQLETLMQHNWLQGMRDHLSISQIMATPDDAQHRVVRRVQAKSSPARARRRLIRRKGLSPESALEMIPEQPREQLKLPFIEFSSQSTGQHFFLFIEHGPLQQSPSPGDFNAFGLSQQGSIPWF